MKSSLNLKGKLFPSVHYVRVGTSFALLDTCAPADQPPVKEFNIKTM